MLPHPRESASSAVIPALVAALRPRYVIRGDLRLFAKLAIAGRTLFAVQIVYRCVDASRKLLNRMLGRNQLYRRKVGSITPGVARQ